MCLVPCRERADCRKMPEVMLHQVWNKTDLLTERQAAADVQCCWLITINSCVVRMGASQQQVQHLLFLHRRKDSQAFPARTRTEVYGFQMFPVVLDCFWISS